MQIIHLWVDKKRCPRGDHTKSTRKVVDENVAGPPPGQLENESCLGPGPGGKRDAIKLIQRVHIGLAYMDLSQPFTELFYLL